MADAMWRGARIGGTHSIHAGAQARLIVYGGIARLDRSGLPQAKADVNAAVVGGMERARLVQRDGAVTRQIFGKRDQMFLIRYTPDNFAKVRLLADAWRQPRRVFRTRDHLAASAGDKHRCRFAARGFLQPPIREQFFRQGKIRRAIHNGCYACECHAYSCNLMTILPVLSAQAGFEGQSGFGTA